MVACNNFFYYYLRILLLTLDLPFIVKKYDIIGNYYLALSSYLHNRVTVCIWPKDKMSHINQLLYTFVRN